MLAKSLRLNTQVSLLGKRGLSESCSCLTGLSYTEAIFVSAHSPQVCAKNIAEIRQLAREQFGRNPSNLKVLALVTPILGRTEGEALAKLKDYRQYASHEGALALFAGWVSIFWTQFETLKEETLSDLQPVLKAFNVLLALKQVLTNPLLWSFLLFIWSSSPGALMADSECCRLVLT